MSSYRPDAIGSDSPRNNNIAEIYKDFTKNLSLKKAVKRFAGPEIGLMLNGSKRTDTTAAYGGAFDNY